MRGKERIKKQKHVDTLLVEDNPADAELILKALKKNGIGENILHLQDGAEALKFFFGSEGIRSDLPSLILLDINLPKVNGIEVLKRLRAEEKTHHIPVGIFTVSEKDKNMLDSYKLGVNFYIHKQTDYRDFERSISQINLYLKELKVLQVEDVPEDAELIRHELKKSKIRFVSEIVDTRSKYIAKLKEFEPDVILSDFSLPRFDAIQAVRILKESNLNIPFILITGNLSEEAALACLSEGMDDFLLKTKLNRLPAALLNALNKKKIEDDKRKAIEALRENEEYLTTIIETEPQCVSVIDRETNVRKINTAGLLLFETADSRKIIGKKIISLIKDNFRKPYSRFIDRIFSGHKDSIECQITGLKNTEKWVESFAAPLYSKDGQVYAMLAISNDITSRKISQRKLENALNQLKTLFDNIEEVFFSIDLADHKLLQISPAAEKLFGKPIPYFYSEPDFWMKFIHEDDRSFIEKEVEKLKKGTAIANEYKIVRYENEIVWVESKITPTLDSKKKLIRLDAVMSDITQRKLTEEKLKSKVNELDTFIYRTSHDLKGPLSTLFGLIDIAGKDVSDPSLLRYLELIRVSVEKLDAVLTELTNITGLNSRKITPSRIDFRHFIAEVLETHQNLPNFHKIKIKVTATVPELFCDKVLLLNMVSPVIRNAIMYCRPEEQPFINIAYTENERERCIVIKDNGEGIPKGMQENIFDMFFRGNLKSEGSGLGLYIARSAAERLGGKIDVSSRTGEGSTFTIHLPTDKPAKAL